MHAKQENTNVRRACGCRSAALNGFTLVELAIVLVVIGLLVGGVLAGRELIEVATLNKQVSEWGQLKTAYLVYKDRNHAIPGDDPRATLRFPNATNSNQPNGVLGSTHINGMGLYTRVGEHGGNEKCLFFQHLYLAGLFAAINPNCTIATPRAKTSLPPLLGSSRSYYYVIDPNIPGTGRAMSGGKLICTGIPYTSGWAYGELTSYNQEETGASRYPLSVAQSYYLDTKLDDGRPLTGHVKAVIAYGGGATFLCSQTDSLLNVNSYCKNASDAYNVTSGLGCALSIRMGVE